MAALNIDRFSFRQMFNDTHGKTSGALFCGFWLCIASIAGFLISIFIKFNDGILGAIAFAGVGGTLFGIRRFTEDKPPIIAEPTSSTVTTESFVGTVEVAQETTTIN
jgi:hypothetical protein